MYTVNEQRHCMPAVLPGFEHVNRYWDKRRQTYASRIHPGEYYVTKNNETIVTVLGSCISACIRDRVLGVGGMNHFMLPQTTEDNMYKWSAEKVSLAARYGNYAMEHMINDILKHGGSKNNLEVKICGGAKIMKNMSDIGFMNISFIRRYLYVEGYEITSEDVGDIYPRKVQYWPSTGRLRIKKLRRLHNDTVVKREVEYKHEIEDKPIAGEIELF